MSSSPTQPINSLSLLILLYFFANPNEVDSFLTGSRLSVVSMAVLFQNLNPLRPEDF